MSNDIRTQHSGLLRHSCSDCEKTFASNTAVKYHLKKCHPRPSGIKCDDCEEIFSNLESFKLHSKKHTAPTEHKCDECHATFSSKTNLNRHAMEEHKIVNINVRKTSLKHYPFICDECDFYTKRKHYLKLHMLKMHSPDPEMISCNFCQETFK
jgi:KRAB domain-containing zinc finger protein